MSWRHRVRRDKHGELQIVEHYSLADGSSAWGEPFLSGGDFTELRETLNRMMAAVAKAVAGTEEVLEESDFASED